MGLQDRYSRTFMTEANTTRSDTFAEMPELAHLAAPLVSCFVVSTGMGIVDTAMLAHLGAVPLAAVSLVSSVLIIFYAGLWGFTGPAGIFAGQAFGGNNLPEIGRIAMHATILSILAGIIGASVMAAGLLVLPWLSQPPEVLEVIGPYWLFMSAMLVPYTVTMAAKQILDATGRAWMGVALTVIPILLNIFLNWVFISGHLGAPALGLTGAGLASFLAQLVGALMILSYVRYTPSVHEWWSQPKWQGKNFREQLREGLPMSAGYFAEGGAVAVVGVMIGVVGTIALAGNQIALSVSVVLYMLPLGMSAAVTIRVSQVMGAGEKHRIAAIGYAGLMIVSVWLSCFALLFMFAGERISRLFVDDASVIAAATAIFFVFGVTQLMDGIQSVSLGALRGMLDNTWPSIVSIIAYWLIALPLAWVIGITFNHGAAGVWAGFGTGLCVAAIVLLSRFLRKSRAA
jgi:multidrug resistance protein, MATE family